MFPTTGNIDVDAVFDEDGVGRAIVGLENEEF